MKKTFAIIGVAGYIAPKHLKAIKDVGGELKYAMDINDSVGILDAYFDDCLFTTKLSQFKKWLCKDNIDYLVICVPNYLHYEFIKLGLKYCKEVICEKPLVIKRKHFDKLLKYSDRINCILQLRLSKNVGKIKSMIKDGYNKIHINYFVKRGQWYESSWKSNDKKSGGLFYNIGIHIFDFVNYLNLVSSVDVGICKTKKREIIIDGKTIDLSDGFENLHGKSYKEILKGNGFHVKHLTRVMDYLYECEKNRKSHKG